MKNLLWIVPVGLIAWFAYTRSKFTFSFTGLKLKPKPSILMQVYNPTSESSTINSIVSDIFYKGNRLGIINQFTPFSIKANQRTTVALPVNLDAVGFATLIQEISTNPKEIAKNAVVEIKGTVNVSGLPVSFTQTFKLS